jgi:hypothetical protein
MRRLFARAAGIIAYVRAPGVLSFSHGRSARVSSSGALACCFALRLAAPHRLAAALAAAAPAEDTLAALPIEICSRGVAVSNAQIM